MKRVKFIKDCNGYRAGDVAYIASELATHYAKEGIAMVSKDMTSKDYKTAKSQNESTK